LTPLPAREAIADVERAIDRTLAPKKLKLVRPDRVVVGLPQISGHLAELAHRKQQKLSVVVGGTSLLCQYECDLRHAVDITNLGLQVEIGACKSLALCLRHNAQVLWIRAAAET
jgi:hypothetical protein